ncbi:DUF397 domain-containing protein [Actinomadura sp. 1N219]|uniref:DUF397 domain-containing protein n=1 Tax=Actinomadura sp. 1N219 TaxID=3375152 RepID=UPI0037A1D90A
MIKWRKSTHSGGGNDDACVELARLGGGIGVRDSKNPEGERLGFSSQEFSGLVARIKRGEFVLPADT